VITTTTKNGKNLVSAGSIQQEDLNDSDFFKTLRQPFRLARLALSFLKKKNFQHWVFDKKFIVIFLILSFNI
jgi:hypothetical protein